MRVIHNIDNKTINNSHISSSNNNITLNNNNMDNINNNHNIINNNRNFSSLSSNRIIINTHNRHQQQVEADPSPFR